MSRRPKQTQRRSRFGHGLAAALLALLPLLAIAGVVAPNAIMVEYVEEEEEELAYERSGPYRPVRLAKSPLLIPRDYSAGFVPELTDVEQLFIGADYRSATKRLARLPSFPSSFGDVIVVDDVDGHIGARIFKDVLDLSLVADTSHLDPENWDVIGPLWPAGNGLQYDDFTGGNGVPGVDPRLLLLLAVIVPEPNTGLMVGLGLCALAIRRRGQRQPATS